MTKDTIFYVFERTEPSRQHQVNSEETARAEQQDRTANGRYLTCENEIEARLHYIDFLLLTLHRLPKALDVAICRLKPAIPLRRL